MTATILICGGRAFNDWNYFRDRMARIALKRFPRLPLDERSIIEFDIHVITGGAQGADKMGREWANIFACSYKEYKADWDQYKKAAGPIRNSQMLSEGKPDFVVAFMGGKGTADMCRKAEAAGVEVIQASASEWDA